MFRYIVLVAFYSFFSLPTVAQALGDGRAQNHADQHSRGNTGVRSRGNAENQVSISRLMVPRKARRLYEEAVKAWDKQEPTEAQRKVEQALEIDPTFPEALTLHGFIQVSLQQWEAAEESLKAAIHSDPTYSPASVILAGVYNRQKRWNEAQEATRQALSAGANTWSVQYEIARALIGKGQYDNALAITDEALNSKPGSLLHVAKAHALLGLRRYPEAATELRAYLRDEPSGEGSQDARHILERIQRFVSR